MEQKIFGLPVVKTDKQITEADIPVFGFMGKDGKPVICEFCDDPATEHHIDYYTCKEHLHIAVDNVSCRSLP